MKGVLTAIAFAAVFLGSVLLAGFASRLGLPEFVGYLFFVPIVICVLVLLLLAAVLRSMPTTVRLAPLQDRSVPQPLLDLTHKMERHGFHTILKPRIGNTHPPVILIPLILDDGTAYGTVFQSVADTARIGIDIVSMLDSVDGKNLTTLTTSNLVEGGVVEPASGCFVQIFPNVEVNVMRRHHQAAESFLRNHGIAIKPVEPGGFERDYANSFAGVRRKFLSNPIWNTMVATGRTLAKRSPYLGPIQRQSRAQKTLDDRSRGVM